MESNKFKVTFEMLYPDVPVSYKIHTVYGAQKAIVIATQAHEFNGKGHILSVSVKIILGGKPTDDYYDDRMEW
ncbi:MAG: hypothetical protein ACSHW0_19390 [Thalassotalea sp.]